VNTRKGDPFFDEMPEITMPEMPKIERKESKY